MSIITLSALLDQISGRIGTVIFCRDGVGGPYVRGFGPVFNPQTPYQSEVRNLLIANSREWVELTEENRAAWNDFAKTHKWPNRLAQDTTITGFDWYSKLMFQANYYAETGSTRVHLDTPPQNLSVHPLTQVAVVSAVAATGVITCTLTPAPSVVADTLQCFQLSDLIPTGITKAPRLNFSFAQPNDEAAISDYNYQPDRYSSPVAGQRAAVGVFRIKHTTGAMTDPIVQTFTWS